MQIALVKPCMAARGNKKILVVEDDRFIQETLKVLLNMEGYEVDVANNGLEALNLLSSSSCPPDLIVLDLMMPIMNGLEFHKHIKNHPRWGAIPIILLTTDPRADERGKQMGARESLKKPVEMNRLLEVVYRECHSRAA
jgi:CheY-like chemotaxis protein